MEIEDTDLSALPDGSYHGQFKGGGGIYEATVSISEHKILSIDQTSSRESKYIRFSKPTVQRIIEHQNANVDAITGATTTSKCIMKAVEDALLR